MLIWSSGVGVTSWVELHDHVTVWVEFFLGGIPPGWNDDHACVPCDCCLFLAVLQGLGDCVSCWLGLWLVETAVLW